MALTKKHALDAYTSNESASVVAKRLGVDEGTVRKIRLKKTWKALTDEYDAAPFSGDRGDSEGGGVSPVGEGRQAGVTVQEDRTGDDGKAGVSGVAVAEGVAEERLRGREGAGEAHAGDHQGHPRHVGEGDPLKSFPLHTTQPIPYSGDDASQAVALESINRAFLASEPASAADRDIAGELAHAAFADTFTAPDGRRDLFPATLPPLPERKQRVQRTDEPKPPPCPKGLEARFAKVLIAAKQYGKVRGLHGYGGKSLTDPGTIASAERREEIERINETFMPSPALARQLKLGLIAPGEHANTFVLTDAGKARLEEYDAYLEAHNDYLHRLALWRREVRRKVAAEGELVGDVA